SVTCSADGTKSATVNVQTGVAAVYIGGAPSTWNLNAPSVYMPDSSATPIPLVSVDLQSLLDLLGLGVVTSSLKVLTLGLINLNQITVNINIQPGQVTIPVANQGQTALTFKYPGPGSSVSPSPAPPYTL
uniref:hypothetical protein n=1 Tax=Listeria monocytogenes TaxID=1639 RepID=UPI003F664F8E